nr:uncharacterized protein LOC126524499 [Dermacentor andersoni]
MDASTRLISVLLFSLAGPCQTESSYVSTLHCQRLVPPAVTSALTPCRFPCIMKYLRAPSSIIMQSEPDGTPCRHTGHCRGGACLDIGNYAAPEHFEWGPSSGITSYHNSNTNADTHAGRTAVSTGGGYARYGFLSGAKVNPYTDQIMRENEKERGAPLFPSELSALNALEHLLRMKRAAPRSEEGRRGIELTESGKYISLARVRRSSKTRRITIYDVRPQSHYYVPTHSNRNTYGARSGVYDPPYGPRNPAVVVVHSPHKKSRAKSLLKGAAMGVAVGGAGVAAYSLLGGGNKHKHTSSRGAAGAEGKSSQPNRPDEEVNAVGAQGTATGNTGHAGISTPEGNDDAENDDKKETDGAETGTKAEGAETGATDTTGTNEARKTNSSKNEANEDAGTDKTNENR